ncbi:MAG: leucyl/phenylalanyl-tRNA--protein transferase [Candidatus Berkiellales bacterium]
MDKDSGLVKIGGDLSPESLIKGYRAGIFPWFEEEPILWWSPDPRAVLFLDHFHLSHSLKKVLRKKNYAVTVDQQFGDVIAGCAEPRPDQIEPGTWITPSMQAAYGQLHQLGYAHSIEVRRQHKLIGGLYGVALGKIFFAESMFSREKNASKLALVYLVFQLKRWGFELIDCQIPSLHLTTLGVTELSRTLFLQKIEANNLLANAPGKWTLDPDLAEEFC